MKYHYNVKKLWKRRIELAELSPAQLEHVSASDTTILKEDIPHFRKRFKERQRHRQKRKKDLDKRIAARDKAKGEVDQTFEKKENWVYRDGDNFNIRWSAMPR